MSDILHHMEASGVSKREIDACFDAAEPKEAALGLLETHFNPRADLRGTDGTVYQWDQLVEVLLADSRFRQLMSLSPIRASFAAGLPHTEAEQVQDDEDRRALLGWLGNIQDADHGAVDWHMLCLI